MDHPRGTVTEWACVAHRSKAPGSAVGDRGPNTAVASSYPYVIVATAASWQCRREHSRTRLTVANRTISVGDGYAGSMSQLPPLRGHARRRDRHGRGLRGPVIPGALPAARTRADKFDDLIGYDLATFRTHLGNKMSHIDFGVLDVPEYEPAPWEDGVPLARYIPFERPAKITGRIVFYRMPILEAAERTDDPRMFIHDVVTGQLASALGQNPEDIDYLF